METTLLSPAETILCKSEIGILGSFYKSLLHTIRIADDQNRERLAMGFPELVEVIQRYRNEEGYSQTIFDKWNKENPNHIIR